MLKETNLAADTGCQDSQIDIAELMAAIVCSRIDKGSIWTNINFHELNIGSFLLKLFRELLQFPGDLDLEVFWYGRSDGDSPKTEQKASFPAKGRRDQDDPTVLHPVGSELLEFDKVLNPGCLFEFFDGLFREFQSLQGCRSVSVGAVREELNSLQNELEFLRSRHLAES